VKPNDRRWLWLYGLLFVPYVGPLVLVVGSSVAYCAWRGMYPVAARRLNRHAWIAIGLNVITHVLLFRRC
jgi:hypothetical protein